MINKGSEYSLPLSKCQIHFVVKNGKLFTKTLQRQQYQAALNLTSSGQTELAKRLSQESSAASDLVDHGPALDKN
jgi:hypothetical protein